MPSGLAGPEAARVLRWMADSPAVFETLRRMLHEYDQAKETARAAQTEQDRLQQHWAALREEVQQLRAEVARLKKERAEAAQWFATMLQEASARFPLTPPPT